MPYLLINPKLLKKIKITKLQPGKAMCEIATSTNRMFSKINSPVVINPVCRPKKAEQITDELLLPLKRLVNWSLYENSSISRDDAADELLLSLKRLVNWSLFENPSISRDDAAG